tara:strand:- start:877 stop:1155 length:279 start_codon:yes stop_codon:yes gene_type:complete
MSKSNKKRKVTKKDLKNMVSEKPLERVMKDMEIVNGLMDKINDFRFGDELNEEEADKIKKDLKEVEVYLKGQYGDYLDLDLDNIDDIDDIIK